MKLNILIKYNVFEKKYCGSIRLIGGFEMLVNSTYIPSLFIHTLTHSILSLTQKPLDLTPQLSYSSLVVDVRFINEARVCSGPVWIVFRVME
jgi:hypothetical protein